jgi:hypothetical protein
MPFYAARAKPGGRAIESVRQVTGPTPALRHRRRHVRRGPSRRSRARSPSSVPSTPRARGRTHPLADLAPLSQIYEHALERLSASPTRQGGFPPSLAPQPGGTFHGGISGRVGRSDGGTFRRGDVPTGGNSGQADVPTAGRSGQVGRSDRRTSTALKPRLYAERDGHGGTDGPTLQRRTFRPRQAAKPRSTFCAYRRSTGSTRIRIDLHVEASTAFEQLRVGSTRR